MRENRIRLESICIFLLFILLLSACSLPFHEDLFQAKAAGILKVTYNGNGNSGGAVPTDGNTYPSGATVTVAGAGTMVRSGFTFANWNTASDGSGTSYAAGASMTMGSANVTLYATWTALPTYSVTYDGNGSDGGTVPTDGNTYPSGATVTVAGAGTMVRSGFTFANWNTASDGSGTSYAAGASMTMGSANVTLYATWTAIPTYSVTYDGNGSDGGTVPTDGNTYPSGATVTVAGAGTMVRSGFTFANWNTASDGSGTSYAAGASMTMGSANVTLYATWTALPTYSVTYDGNGSDGGTVPTDGNTYPSGATVTVAGAGTMVRSGFTFANWNTASDGSGTSYAAGASMTMGSANVTLYATWTAIPTYSVSYDGNGSDGGTVPTDGTSYPTGSTVTVLSPGTLSLSNGIFSGWNTAADGSGTAYSSGDTFAMGTGNVTLYAMWSIVSGSTLTSVPLSATEVVIPSTITYFGTVFQDHPNLTSVTIPASVTAIDVQAFRNCPQLTTIVSSNAQFQVINGALVDSTNHRLMLVPAKLSGAFSIPASITSIDVYAFEHCTNLTSITIPASLGYIGANTFSGLLSPISISIPSTITTIGDYAFSNSSITSITIASSVTSIGNGVFQSCAGLTSVTMQASTPPSLGTTAFTTPYPTIHVPNSAAVTAYSAATNWSTYSAVIVTP